MWNTQTIRNCNSLLIAGLLSAISWQSNAQTLPLDPAVHTGKLANGFTYYIRHNTEPKKRVVFYLVNKIGSMQEDEDQRGLAHFLEHMSFNGTKHYPKNELVGYLQKSGVRFGADLNAYTAFDETVYQLPLPSDDTSIVRHGLQIMRDWANEATLETVEINKERGVILEEKRLRNGPQQRMMEQYFPMQLNGSRYADRLPIGLEKVLTTFTPATIKRFYKDWYRPNLQALIVVGDIDVQQMEQQVKLLFGDLKNPVKQRQRIHYSIPLTGKNQFKTVTDPEQTVTQLQVLIKQPEMPNRTTADYRASIVKALLNHALSGRLQELATQANPPFMQAQAGMSDFMGGLDAFAVSIVPKPGKMQQSFTDVWTEIARMKEFGLTSEELERSKTAFLHPYERAYKEKDKTASGSYVDEYVQYFLKGTMASGIEVEYKLVQELLPQITLAEVHDFAKKVIKGTDRDILVLAPQKDKDSLPKETTVNSWITQVGQAKLTPWKDTYQAESLLSTLPAAGRVVSRTTIGSLGITQLQLSNGVKVLLKPSDFKNDQLLFTAFSEGGTSLYPNEVFLSAVNAGQLIPANGVGSLSATNLSKLLTGKSVQVQPFIQERYEGINGRTNPADVETCLQLLYLYFTAPRKDSVVFNNIISRSKAGIANKDDSPESVFSDSATAILGMYNYRRLPMTEKRMDSISLEEMYTVYKERFSNAGDFTFVFAGSLDTARLIPLIEQYIGALPSDGKKEAARDLGIHIPEGKISKTINRGNDNKASVNLIYSGTYTYNEFNNFRLSALGTVLQYRMLERIREAEGGAYTPQAGVSYNKTPESRYAFTIRFTCAPANVEKLIAAANEEVAKLKAEGPPADDLGKFTAEQARGLETQLQTNQFWLQYISARLQNDEPLDNSIFTLNERLKKITAEDVKEAAKEYLKTENYIRLILMPETK